MVKFKSHKYPMVYTLLNKLNFLIISCIYFKSNIFATFEKKIWVITGITLISLLRHTRYNLLILTNCTKYLYKGHYRDTYYLYKVYSEFLGMLTKNYRVILGIPSITFVSLLKFTRYNLRILTNYTKY